MKPDRHPQATLVDLLDRVLDRGLIIQLDLIISVADIPLIGVNLRAALAGIETMVEYGMMADWDTSIRAKALRAGRATAPSNPEAEASCAGKRRRR